jgi:hypothetical protein
MKKVVFIRAENFEWQTVAVSFLIMQGMLYSGNTEHLFTNYHEGRGVYTILELLFY